MPFKAPEQPKCTICGKSVYAMEEIVFGGNKMHKGCFKCAACQKPLCLASVVEYQGANHCRYCSEEKRRQAMGISNRSLPVNAAPQ